MSWLSEQNEEVGITETEKLREGDWDPGLRGEGRRQLWLLYWELRCSDNEAGSANIGKAANWIQLLLWEGAAATKV